MANIIEIVSRFDDQATPGIDRMAQSLGRVEQAGTRGARGVGEANSKLAKLGSEATPNVRRLDDQIERLLGTFLLMQTGSTAAAGGVSVLAAAIGGFAIGGIVGAAVVGLVELGKLFIALREEAEKSRKAIAAATSQTAKTALATSLEIRRIEAASSGDKLREAEAVASKTIALAKAERDEKLRSATESTKDADVLAALRVQIEREAAGKIRVAEVQLAADRQKIAKESSEERIKLLKQVSDALAKSGEESVALDRKAQDAARARVIGERQAAQDILAVIDLTREQKLKMFDRERIDALAVEQKASIERVALARKAGIELTEESRESAQKRLAIEQKFLADVGTAEADAAAKRKQAIEAAIDAAAGLADEATGSLGGLFAQLGAGFEDLAEKFTKESELKKAAANFRALDTLLQGDKLSATQAAEAVRILTERLVESGQTIDDIATIVPDALRQTTSLFREATASVGAIEDGAESATTALGSITTAAQIVGGELENQRTRLQDYLESIARAAASARLKLLGVARAAASIHAGAPAIVASGDEPTPEFQAGGLVPGPRGRRRLIVAHGGERVLSLDEARGADRAAPAAIHVHLDGTTILESERALDALAVRIGRVVSDQRRRGRG